MSVFLMIQKCDNYLFMSACIIVLCRLPVLLQTAGVTGRVIAVFVFLSMVIAGITSAIGFIELIILPLEDFAGKRLEELKAFTRD